MDTQECYNCYSDEEDFDHEDSYEEESEEENEKHHEENEKEILAEVNCDTFDFQLDSPFINFTNKSPFKNQEEQTTQEKLNYQNVLLESIKQKRLFSFELIPDSFKQDIEVIKSLLIQNEKEYQNIPKELQNDKSIMMEVVSKNQKIYQNLKNELKNDEEIINTFIENKGSFYFIPSEKKKKKSIALKAMIIDGSQLRYCPEEFKNDLDIVKEAFIQNRFSIDHIGEEIKNNVEFALYVVSMKPLDIQYFNETVRSNHQVAYNAIKKDQSAIRFLPPIALSDKDLAIQIISINGKLINRFSNSILNDFEIQKKALEQNGLSLIYFNQPNKELINIALKKTPSSLEYLSKEYYTKENVLNGIKDGLPNDKIPIEFFENYDFCLEVAASRGELYVKFNNEIKKDIKIINAAALSYPNILSKIPKEILNNIDFANEMIERDHKNWEYFQEFFENNKEIVLKVVNKDGKKLFNCSLELRDDDDVVETAITQNGTSLLFASERLKQNLNFVKKMLKTNPELLGSCPKNIQENIEIILCVKNMYPKLVLDQKIKRLFDLNFYFTQEKEENKKYDTFVFEFSNVSNFEFGLDNKKLNLEFNSSPNKFNFTPSELIIDTSSTNRFDFTSNNSTKKITPTKGRMKRSTPKKKIVKNDHSEETFLSMEQMKSLEESLQELNDND
eukprot:gene7557-11880_t